jgi:hypothetical protein
MRQGAFTDKRIRFKRGLRDLSGILMDQHAVNIAVQGLWLQYQELTIGSVSSWHPVENAAWKTSPLSQPEDLPATGGLMVAS